MAKRLGIQLRQSLHSQGIDTVDSQEILVNRIKHPTQVIYGSAIALKSASQLHQSTFELAEVILTNFRSLHLGDFTFELLPSGMLQFVLTDQGMANWLEEIICYPWKNTPIQDLAISPERFRIQYTHARCCSLLRLAHRDHLITLIESDLISLLPLKRDRISAAIPWLTVKGKLQFIERCEYQLLTQFVNIVDVLFSSSDSSSWEKLAEQLSQNFQLFYCQCRIWGEVKQNTPELAQARLGLVLITQILLQILLEEKLGIMAPVEL
ncbi:DALR anticodon-binding domain-containing protein [Planktothrix serta]|uniref:DALR anticodon-binding domain-containing protein n=1 Tax=Planktothrix serta TaxID=1678310 RepID=UPI0012DD2E11|nr:DALR anticodon-binding domain-containing protein [Planktothrix serta]